MREFTDFDELLQRVYQESPSSIEGDDLGTTYLTVGVILLSVTALDTSSSLLLSTVTGLPQELCNHVLTCIEKCNSTVSSAIADLQSTIRNSPSNVFEVRSALDAALEIFWLKGCANEFTERLFQQARGRLILGGKKQDWIDTEELEEFLAGLRVAECTRKRLSRTRRF